MPGLICLVMVHSKYVKKVLFLILFILCSNLLRSFSLYKQIEMVVGLPQSSLFLLMEENSTYLSANYHDIYHYKKNKKEEIFEKSLINVKQNWKISNLIAQFQLIKRNGYFFINDIDDIEDEIYINKNDIFAGINLDYRLSNQFGLKFYLEKTNKVGWLLGITKKYNSHKFLLQAGIRFNENKLNYNIQNLSSFFPFRYGFIDKKVNYQNNNLNIILIHQDIIPDENNADEYPGKIAGQNLSLNTEWKEENFIFNVFVSLLAFSGDFKHDEKKFCELDDFSLYYSRIKIDRLAKIIGFSLGLEYYRFKVGSDSYLDIWPFSVWIAIYDFDKIRLKKFNTELIQPFINISKKFKYKKSSHNIYLSYNHLFFQNDYLYKKREIIFVYPQYVTYVGSVDLDIDAIFEIKYDLFFPINNSLEMNFNISQQIPINYDKLTHTSGGEDLFQSKSHGGTKIAMSFVYFW